MNEPAAELCRPAPGGWRTAVLTTRALAAGARRPRPWPCPQPALGPPTALTYSLPNTEVLPDCGLSESSPARRPFLCPLFPGLHGAPESLFRTGSASVLSLPGCLPRREFLRPFQPSAYPLSSPFRISLSLLSWVTPISHLLSTGRFSSPTSGYQGCHSRGGSSEEEDGILVPRPTPC